MPLSIETRQNVLPLLTNPVAATRRFVEKCSRFSRYATEAEAFLERPAVDVAPTGPSAPGETALVGRTVSHYQVLSLLGAGGMGEVYLARDPRLDRTVALKILPGDVAVDPDRMLRFEREARAASALNHPNVATIYDVGESDGIHFIVMEHVEGETSPQESAASSHPRKSSTSQCRPLTHWMSPTQRASRTAISSQPT